LYSARPPSPDELRLVQTQEQAKILLLGPAVFTPAGTFKNRTVLVLAEEVSELGATSVLPADYKAETGPRSSKPWVTTKSAICSATWPASLDSERSCDSGGVCQGRPPG